MIGTVAGNHELPAGWKWARLGEVAEVRSGNPAPQEDRHFLDGEFPFVRTSDVGVAHISGRFATAADRVNKEAVRELRLRLFPSGTILFPKSGASTYVNHRVVLEAPAYVSNHLACIMTDRLKASPQFVFRWLCLVDSRDLTSGQSYPSLRLSQIADIQVPVPPIDEQHRIVRDLGERLALADAAKRELEAQLSIVETLTAAYLREAFAGGI